jgi:hypothetical protein
VTANLYVEDRLDDDGQIILPRASADDKRHLFRQSPNSKFFEGKAEPPTTSWWLGLDRDAFNRRQRERQQAMDGMRTAK